MIKLFEFAKKKQQQKGSDYKNQSQNQKQFYKTKQNKPKNVSQIDDDFNLDIKSNKSYNNTQKSVGLSTLLHFAGEDDESSIHFSKYEDKVIKKRSNGFKKTKVEKYEQQQRLKSSLKYEIEQMKQKRIALQDKKNKRRNYPTQVKQDSMSQQQSYKKIQGQSYQKTQNKLESSYLMLNSREQDQQSYVKYLLQENAKLKLEKFTNKILKFYHQYLVKHMILRLQIIKFTQKIQKKQNFQLQKNIFIEWKILARQQTQRNQLIQTIKTKILNKRLQ